MEKNTPSIQADLVIIERQLVTRVVVEGVLILLILVFFFFFFFSRPTRQHPHT